MIGRIVLAAAILACAAPAQAGLDLAQAEVTHLGNGLTVIILPDHSLPIVSVQVLYKTGSGDEEPGKTGLAHFLEHLAFRATENFPDGAAADAIYDAGGEWHGYTWIDQTTYFATVPKAGIGPKDGLTLLLEIEADRMDRVAIDPASMDAEAGAVITELHGYENDPSSVLFDAVAAAALQVHPYRIPTIGYEGDIAALTAEDARSFYRANYAPDNAVLAIAGDVDPQEALAQVRARFGSIARGPGVHRTKAVEPSQGGARRIRIAGPVERPRLEIAYPAPAVSSPDWPGFLLLQQLVAGGSGVNFRQNDWGAPVVEGTALAGVADDLTSLFIPTREPYLFTIGATAPSVDQEAALESEIDARLAALREAAPSQAALDAARAAVRAQLAFDVETTEDAAHQLAFFEGMGGLDVLLGLDERLAAVTPQDILRLARTYLAPTQRTVGWYEPGDRIVAPRPGIGDPKSSLDRPLGTAAQVHMVGPQLRRLSGGMPAIVQSSPLSPTVTVEVALSAPGEEGDTIVRSGLASDLPRLLDEARDAVQGIGAAPIAAASRDPYARLMQLLAEQTGSQRNRLGRQPQPVVVAISGAVDADAAFHALERAFGDFALASLAPASNDEGFGDETVRETIALPLSQAALGYVVSAPPPATRGGLAFRMALYALTHEYGGRLGDSAIKRRGLTYYIDSDYAGDTTRGWVTLATGVDPDKIDAMAAALRAELARLASDPPDLVEIEAARRNLLGRDLSAAQSNAEIAHKLARTFVESGALPDHAALAEALSAITSAEVADAARALGRGTVVRVDVGADR